ncbi:MAG TPA: winged helix-turn-helix domain-containing protein [Archangium sp.]|uniref:helix-turn-helix transcriptional regulator n=1 Tax=Archangium sp. TaxID=1872627 RepID=UPI002E2F4FB9|nr:winged helix-turn-helix domain-containing protein [Archangium sp.]HEX5751696.1 winged helix-turn-helix domain-containing protein [Archangium sp.]
MATRASRPVKEPAPVAWTFLTNHAHVLLCLARTPDARMREVADEVGITERAVQRIVSELEEAGYLRRTKEGRRNTYSVRADLPLRHPIESHRTVASLLALVLEPEPGGRPKR